MRGRGCVTATHWEWFVFSLVHSFLLTIGVISFLFNFFVGVWIIIFSCCLASVDFLSSFLLYFTLFFVNLGGLSLPCHLLCCLLLFIFCCYLFFFFFLHGFSVFFVSLIALGTSLRLVMSPLGVGCTAPPFRGRVSKGSKLYNWWFGKARGLIDKIWWIWYFEETVDDGVGSTMPGRGAVSGCSCSTGWSRLDDLGDGVYCFVFYLLKIHGDCW